MTKQEFCEEYLGRVWHRADFNCFDLVRDSFRLIDDVELRHVTDEAFAIDTVRSDYTRCKRQEGAVFHCYDSNGNWVHIGRILMGKAFHAVRDGCVCFWELDALERMYKMQGGRVEYTLPKGVK